MSQPINITICRRFSHAIHAEPPVGIEPTTARLRIECSTAELRWRTTDSTRSHHALERTRTAKPFGTTPSRWRVYQFHHQGNAMRTCNTR